MIRHSSSQYATVKREEREYQQDATIRMFIINFRCLLSTTVSTCFGHYYAHHQENKDRVLLHMVQLQPATSSTTSAKHHVQ